MGELYYASLCYVEPTIAALADSYDELEVDLTRTHYIDPEASHWLASMGADRNCHIKFLVYERQRRVRQCLSDIAGVGNDRIRLLTVPG
jgi:hypothetical protein